LKKNFKIFRFLQRWKEYGDGGKATTCKALISGFFQESSVQPVDVGTINLQKSIAEGKKQQIAKLSTITK